MSAGQAGWLAVRMTTDTPSIACLSENGTHSVRFVVEGVPDIEPEYTRNLTFCPDSVTICYSWSTRFGTLPERGWHVTDIRVSGQRRLSSGALGKEIKRRSYHGSDWEKSAPPWLIQLVRRFHPSYPVGVDSDGLPTMWDAADAS